MVGTAGAVLVLRLDRVVLPEADGADLITPVRRALKCVKATTGGYIGGCAPLCALFGYFLSRERKWPPEGWGQPPALLTRNTPGTWDSLLMTPVSSFWSFTASSRLIMA